MPKWLSRSNFLLSVLLGIVTWFVLVGIWTNSAAGGVVDRAIGGFFAPIFRVSVWIGAIVFPNRDDPHSNIRYLLPLIGALCQFVLLTAIWYVSIRLWRALRPEEIPVPSTELAGNEAGDDDRGDLDSEDEPVYIAPIKEHVTRFGSTIDYEKFKLRTWREFRKHNGRWPVFSILFHLSAIAGMLVAMITFFWMKDHRNWDDLQSLVVGAIAAVCNVVFVVIGQKIVWKLDWRVFGAERHSY
jgi:hypothetical protein